MSAGFAGSASQDDRRRRRLVTDSNDEGSTSVLFGPGTPESARNHRFPLKRLVHYKAWRIAVFELAVLLCAGGVIYLSWLESIRDFGPGFSQLFATNTGRAFPFLWGSALFLCGQLACLIGWARSRSLIDFGGRYRVWKWTAAMLFLLSAGILTGADGALTASLDWAGLARPWTAATLDWIVPVGAIALPLLWLTDREVRGSRVARIHLWQGILLLSAGLAVPSVPALDLPREPLVAQGLILGGLVSFAMSLVWFTRHVLYFSCEPAHIRHWNLFGRLRRAFRWMRRIRMPKLGRNKEPREQETDDDDKQKSPPKKKPSRRRGSKKTAAKTPPEPAPAPKPAVTPVQTPEPAFVSQDDREQSARNECLDDPELAERLELMQMMIEEGERIDSDLFKGLNKRQKRILRKKQRQLESEYDARAA